MLATKGAEKRKKVNFMIDHDVLVKLHTFVLPGDRSDFLNKALDEALLKIVRKKASDEIDAFRETHHWRLSMDEIRKLKNYGRA